MQLESYIGDIVRNIKPSKIGIAKLMWEKLGILYINAKDIK